MPSLTKDFFLAATEAETYHLKAPPYYGQISRETRNKYFIPYFSLFVLFTLLPKYLSLVAAFTPPLGLLNTMGHWTTLQTAYSCSLLSRQEDGLHWAVSPAGDVTNTSWSGEALDYPYYQISILSYQMKDGIIEKPPRYYKRYLWELDRLFQLDHQRTDHY